MLSPASGYAYFKKLGNDRASKARVLLQHVYEEYAKKDQNLEPAKDTSSKTRADDTDLLSSIFLMDVEAPLDPEEASELSAVLRVSEFDRFIAVNPGSVTEEEQKNPLMWWKVQSRYLVLSRDRVPSLIDLSASLCRVPDFCQSCSGHLSHTRC